MASQEIIVINSRLGTREVRLDKVIHFPRGIIGFDHLRDFTLLQIQENAPLHVLQSMEDANLGLLVADPFVFMKDYNICVSDAEQQALKASNAADLAVLVTATIPPGKPEHTTLNLLGPILINHCLRIGLQVPQPESGNPGKLFVAMRSLTE